MYSVFTNEWCSFKSQQEIYFSPYTGKTTPLAAATVQVSHALPAVRFSCLLWGRGVSLQDGATEGKGFL